MRYLWLATLTLGLLCASFATAEAKCASPQGTWSLDKGQLLPAKASLFYFAPAWRSAPEAPDVLADKKPVESTWELVSANEAFQSYQLRFDAGAAAKVEIQLEGAATHFRIGDYQPPQESLQPTMGGRETDRWTCSHTDVRTIRVASEAQAFRVRWVDTRNGVLDLGSGVSIFPRSLGRFWTYPGRGDDSEIADIALGHPNCFLYYNLPAKNLDTLLVHLTPLYRDGSEGKTFVVEPRVVPTDQEIPSTLDEEDEQVESLDEQEPEPSEFAPTETVDSDLATTLVLEVPTRRSPVIPVLSALLLGMLLGIGGFLARRRGASIRRLLALGLPLALILGRIAMVLG